MTKSGSGNLGKVGKANHDHKADLMQAFHPAANATNPHGGQRFDMSGRSGLPRSAAQQSSVKKAAAKSAAARTARASQGGPVRTPDAPATPGPGVATGGLALAKKPKGKGLLSL